MLNTSQTNIYLDLRDALCLRCRTGVDEQTCFLCKERKETSQFVKRNHYTDEWRCLACANPSCTSPGCLDAATIKKDTPLPSYLWPKTKEELAKYRFLACRERWTCVTCHNLHLQTNFSSRERIHKYLHYDKPVCLDCMHPACSNPTCTTFKSCRSTTCKEGPSCTKDPEPLTGAALQFLKKKQIMFGV